MSVTDAEFSYVATEGHRRALLRLDEIYQSSRSALADVIIEVSETVKDPAEEMTDTCEEKDETKNEDENTNAHGNDKNKHTDKIRDRTSDDKHEVSDNRHKKAALSAKSLLHKFKADKRLLLPCFSAIGMLALSTYYIHGPGTKFIDRDVYLGHLVLIVMIFGDSVVHKALAISTASPPTYAPLFGCGWLAYALEFLSPAYPPTGDLSPSPNIENGASEKVGALSRKLFDLDYCYASRTPLTIDILDASIPIPTSSRVAGLHSNSSTAAILVAQFFIAVHAYAVTGDLSTILLFITAKFLTDTVARLPLCMSSRVTAHDADGTNAVATLVCSLTHQHATIIKNTHKDVWNLGGPTRVTAPEHDHYNTIEDLVSLVAFFSFLAIAYLSKSLSVSASASILCIMVIGTFGNLVIADPSRWSWTNDSGLKTVDVIQNNQSSILALQQIEEKYPGFGEQLVPVIFQGGLRGAEKLSWAKFMEEHKQDKRQNKLEEKSTLESREDYMAATQDAGDGAWTMVAKET
ncbi:Nn.00g079500.m01.CDS01 [Neocucurbitaria sp. VM-36]